MTAARDRHWGVLGVPSSRAAHWPGLEKGPAALRAAGLVEALAAAGASVTDHGDRPVARWRPRPEAGSGATTGPHDADGVSAVLRDARDALAGVLAAGETPLVLGGECTLALPLAAAAVAALGDVGLVYVDGGQDLQLPADHPEEPILDSMGVAHLLDLPGTVGALAGLGPRRPLLDARALCFLGFADDDEDVHGLVPSTRVPAAEVAADPEGAAGRALVAVTEATPGSGAASRPFLVHLDVDVLDALLLPGADVPQYGRGLTLDVLVAVLEPLVADAGFAGMTLVEHNPDHNPDGTSARRLVAALAPVLAARRAP
ncbi:arginase family protein [Cellulomonas sp. IC4_254]|uniref:arginase family protein n=1 Tax=Cellulomonas sp. IC4_254 TaxID=2714040 RepID=UPI001424A4C1|nr:arginase family protein [Cellulomonas sp. IC4_254]NHT19516.1 arginase family protein [Cellulomonas sp. IC4_254]